VNLLFIWLGFAIVVGIAAAHRGRNGAAWLLLAVVTSPLIAGLLLLVLPDPNKERQQQELLKTARKCPLCAELVRREAIVCKHCGRDLPPCRDHRDDQRTNELKKTPVAAGTYRGYDYVHFSNGTAELKLPSREMETVFDSRRSDRICRCHHWLCISITLAPRVAAWLGER
jgi:hypothetical protein